jgi:trigger factor
MQVTETLADGLKREFRIVIPASDLDQKLSSRLQDLKGRLNMKGFRPGKVPVAFLKKTYGKSLMGEIVEQAMSESTQRALSERSLRPASEPKVELETALETVVGEGHDLAFKMAVELVPEFEIADVAKIKLERPVAEVDEAEVKSMLERLAEDSRTYADKGEGAKAETGDALTIDFLGKIDGEPFEGGKGEDVRLVLGQRQFLPGFEEGLKGAKAGETRALKVKFPDDYSVERLKGKDAAFEVTVHEVRAPQSVEIDDAFAERLGMGNLDKLTQALRERMAGEYKRRSREHLKRRLLDVLDTQHDFALPQGLVDSEFNQIWAQLQHAFEHGHPPEEDVGKSEDQLKAEYHKIAERRVRLGLVLAEIGRRNNIVVTDEEVNRAIGEEARRAPGQERRVYQFYQQNPQALAMLRAPLYEDKVVDFILELAQITERKVSKEELMRDPEAAASEAHEHDHDEAHEHEHEPKAARGRAKAAEKKAAAPKPAKAGAKAAEQKEEKKDQRASTSKAAKPAKGAGKKPKS